jgi:uncharacterized membrane protein
VFKKEVRAPIFALFFISLGGLLLHIRIHPPLEEAFHWVPVGFGVVTAFVLPFLFNSEKTVAWAYLINMAAAIVGTVAMTYVAVGEWQGPITLKAVLFESTLPDIIVLWAKVPLGHHILRHFRPKVADQGGKGGIQT